MDDARFSVLWLCGPPGAGKSTAGSALYAELARSGVRAGFVDVDQLCMCSPKLPDDPHGSRLREINLAVLAGNARAAGCNAFVGAGGMGPSPGHSFITVRDAMWTVCRLRVSPDEQRRRLTSRGEGPDFIAAALRLARELDSASFADVGLDTDGRTVAEVARLVRERCGGWPPGRATGASGDVAPVPMPVSVVPAADADGDVLLVCGATGVGKSTAAFRVFLRQLGAGDAVAYLDLGQLGFLSPLPAGDPGGHRLKARNLADIWRTYHAIGARRLVLSGPVPDERTLAEYRAALPSARFTVCRLHAGPAELAHRISLRGQGLGSWPEPGDPLLGQPEAQLRLISARSAAEAAALERSDLGDLRIDTSDRTAAEAADFIARHWPPARDRESSTAEYSRG